MRLKYLDNAKGLALLFVILGHIITKNTSFKIWIYSFHIPIFFIISGITLYIGYQKRKKLEFNVKNKLKRYGIPYLIFSVIAAFFLSFLSILKNETGIMKELKTNIKAILMLKGVKASWFLPCLFISLFLFYYLYNAIKNKKIFILVVTLLFFLPFLNIDMTNKSTKLVLFRSFEALAFITVGFMYMEHEKKT